jgi:hypothetical protein
LFRPSSTSPARGHGPSRGLISLIGKLAVLGAGLASSACSNETLAVAQSARMLLPAADTHPPLRADRQYLRVSVQGRASLLVLGSLDRSAPAGSIESWFSATGEILRLQHGRVVGTAGLLTDWRAVRISGAPRWGEIELPARRYERERDQMPGYRYGLRETLDLQPIDAVRDSALKDIDPGRLQWFEESSHALTPGMPDLAPARYAVQGHGREAMVVYGEQCLDRDLCLAWQRWPAGPPARAL